MRIPNEIQSWARRHIGSFDVAFENIGLSGATIFHLQTHDGSWCLRCWPSQTSTGRILEIQQLMKVARKRGCSLVPVAPGDGTTDAIAEHSGRAWDLSSWMPGEPLPQDSTERVLAQSVDAIASFHESVTAIHQTSTRPQAILNRLDRCNQIVAENIASRLHDFGMAAGEDPQLKSLAQRASNAWSAQHQTIRYSLDQASERVLPAQWVLRDVHREHILFSDQSGELVPSGIIDFDAARIDTVATDLARYFGSFPSLDQDAISRLLAVYGAKRPFSDQEQDLVPLLIRSSILIAAVNWGHWLCIERQTFAAGQEKAVNRFEQVVIQAEMLF